MATISGVSKLVKLIDQLKEQIEVIQCNVDEKEDWLYATSDSYQESDAFSDWETQIEEVRELLERLESEPITDIEL
jgi:DNA-binding transcriptional regulator GbsR (MarR family)